MREHYTANAGTEDIKNLCELDTSWKIISPANNIHHNIGMADIQPVATRCNQHKDIAELMMRVISVIQLPAHPIVPRECAFAEDSFDESAYARQVARHLGTEHYEDKLSALRAADLISEIGGWLDEPLSDGSLIPTYLLARFVKKHVTVALGGDGGDEIFAGYPMYFAHKVANVYAKILPASHLAILTISSRRPLCQAICELLP